MSVDDNDFPLSEDDFDEHKIALDQMAGILARLFKSLKDQGLSAQEAAAMTAAYFAQGMPQDLQGPQEGS